MEHLISKLKITTINQLVASLVLVQSAAIIVILVSDPVFTDIEALWLVSGLTLIPILCVTITIQSVQKLRQALIIAIIAAWLSASIMFVDLSIGWIMLVPVLVLLSNVLRAQTFLAVGLILGMPLLAGLITNDNAAADSLVDLIAIVLVLALIYNSYDEEQSAKKPTHLSDEQFVALINSMADGVIAVDKERKITVYNGAALDLLNVNATLEGKIVDSYLPIVNKDGKVAKISSLVKKMHGYFVSRDYSLLFPDGDMINLYIGITAVRSGYGSHSATGYVILLRDITKEKSLEEERDEFISVVSHELRTPIAITEGNISNAQILLKSKAKMPEVISALEESHKQAVFLSNLINDLATLSRAERGVLNVDPEDIAVNDFIKELVSDYKEEAKSKGLKIKAVLNSELNLLRTSRLYLHEILQNFVTNSIKYTVEGTITVSAEPVGDSVAFKVKDTGIGISKSDAQHVFDKFFRSEDYRTREHSGTGLGLYVTAKLAKIIGAELKVDSAINQGSEFTITVPNYAGDVGAQNASSSAS